VSTSGAPVQCHPVTANICPSPQSSCRASPTSIGLYYCCSSTGTATNVCPTNYTPLTFNNDPVVCTTSFNSAGTCTAPYQCLQSATNGNFYCCIQGGSASSTCPSGGLALANSFGCIPMPNSCTAGYACQYVAASGGYVCCPSTGVSSSDPCPSPYMSPVIGGVAQQTPCAGTCTSGYYCVTTARGNYCCGVPGVVTNPVASADPEGCPAGMTFRRYTPALALPLSCTTSQSSCPTGSTCNLSSKAGNGYICCDGTVGK